MLQKKGANFHAMKAGEKGNYKIKKYILVAKFYQRRGHALHVKTYKHIMFN
jgi:hypothetical protein